MVDNKKHIVKIQKFNGQQLLVEINRSNNVNNISLDIHLLGIAILIISIINLIIILG